MSPRDIKLSKRSRELSVTGRSPKQLEYLFYQYISCHCFSTLKCQSTQNKERKAPRNKIEERLASHGWIARTDKPLKLIGEDILSRVWSDIRFVKSWHACKSVATIRQGIPMAQKEFIVLERTSASNRLLPNYEYRRTMLKIIFQGDMPPDGPIWKPYSVSTIDLWTFIVAASSYGEIDTVLAMGKDGFGVDKNQFTKVDRQLHRRGVKLKLVTGHDSMAKAKESPALHY